MHRRSSPCHVCVLSVLLFSGFSLSFELFAEDSTQESVTHRALVPHRLLALLHASEVHQELKFSTAQIESLEQLFRETDGEWFRARILKQDERIRILDRLQKQTHNWLEQNATEDQMFRLGQLELQAQGTRCLLRPALIAGLGLTPGQVEQITDLAKKNDEARLRLQQAKVKNVSNEKMERDVQNAVRDEKQAPMQILSPGQQRTLTLMLGTAFDTSQLTRIFPMAPELQKSSQWLNSPPLTLESLRGRVVLIHFYAFQCHNCHANFEIYRRWQRMWNGKDVVVIGIQTPETSKERDPAAISAAAKSEKLDFPIVLDLDSSNWKNWGNTMWPTVYVVDQNGYLRHWWQGELNWKGAKGDFVIESLVDSLLREAGSLR